MNARCEIDQSLFKKGMTERFESKRSIPFLEKRIAGCCKTNQSVFKKVTGRCKVNRSFFLNEWVVAKKLSEVLKNAWAL